MKPSVLVCDAKPALQDLCQSLLTEYVTLRLVPNVERCWQALSEAPIDLLVWDIDSDSLDPLDVLRRLRTAYPMLKVLLASRGVTSEFREDTIRLGRINVLYQSLGPEAVCILILRMVGYVPHNVSEMPFARYIQESLSRPR